MFHSLLSNYSLIFAADAAKSGEGIPGPGIFLIMGSIILLFYMMIIRPQRRQQRQRMEQLKSIVKNDKVVTIGGIHGVVTKAAPDGEYVILRVDDDNNVHLKFAVQAIAKVEKKDGEEGMGNGNKK